MEDYTTGHPILGTGGAASPLTGYEFKQWFLQTHLQKKPGGQ